MTDWAPPTMFERYLFYYQEAIDKGIPFSTLVIKSITQKVERHVKGLDARTVYLPGKKARKR